MTTKNTSKAARYAGQNYRSTELHDDLVSTAPHALLRHGRVVSTYSTYEEAIAAMDAAEGNGWVLVPVGYGNLELTTAERLDTGCLRKLGRSLSIPQVERSLIQAMPEEWLA